MTTIVTRSGKGAALTHTEVDANFTNLNANKAEVSTVLLASEKGAASGVCPLDSTSKVSSTYLPSYVDDVLEYANYAALPATGETGKIYVALDTNKTYRWSGSAYVYITSGAVDSVAGKTGVVTLVKADVGLSNVDNTTDALKPISTATQTALDLKAPIASPTLTGTTTAANLAYTGTLTGSTDILNIGSGQLYKDASGNVGIGVTDFSSTGANAKFAISLGGINLDDAKVLSWGGGSARPYITASKSSAYLAMGVSGTERMRIDSSGNVGIGTSSTYLSSKFTSLNTTNTPAGVFLRPITITNAISVANSYIYMRGQDNGYGLAIGNYSATQWIQGMVNDAPSLDIALNPSGGNVGIGTSSPACRLNVVSGTGNGIQVTDGTVNTLIYNIGSNTSVIGTNTNHPLALYTNNTEKMMIDSSGNVGIGTSSPSKKLSINGDFRLGDGGGTGAIFTDATNGLRFMLPAAGTSNTESMRIDSSGNVGIGVSNPSSYGILTAYSASNPTITIASGNANAYLRLNTTSDLNMYLTNTGGSMTMNTANTERMRINSTGNVGIGTSSPNYPLSVTPSSNGTAINAGNGGFINVYNGDLYPSGSASLNSSGVWTARGTGSASIGLQQAGAMVFYTNAGLTNGSAFSPSERMRIDSSGNVGIGTSSPASVLNVKSTAAGAADIRLSYNASDYMGLSSESGGYKLASVGGGYLSFATSGTERARINASGQFLIGTSGNFFGENLTVYNSNASTAPVAFFYNPNASTTGSALIIQTEGAGGTTWKLIDGRSAGGGGRFFVYGNGNVQNSNNSYGAISDESVKESIVDATHKLDDLCKVKIRNFNLKNDENKIKQIGVVAQELEQIFPAMVEEVDGLKGVKYSIFVPILVKAIQELKAIIDTQQEQINSLLGK